jgi:dipeptidyl-peptidase-4
LDVEILIVPVDNRGCGNQGRAFRAQVASRLGTFEPIDQIWAAETLTGRHDYLDSNKVAYFGWSYGGYLGAKIVERDSGVFTKALIVAPVTAWELYDSRK